VRERRSQQRRRPALRFRSHTSRPGSRTPPRTRTYRCTPSRRGSRCRSPPADRGRRLHRSLAATSNSTGSSRHRRYTARSRRPSCIRRRAASWGRTHPHMWGGPPGRRGDLRTSGMRSGPWRRTCSGSRSSSDRTGRPSKRPRPGKRSPACTGRECCKRRTTRSRRRWWSHSRSSSPTGAGTRPGSRRWSRRLPGTWCSRSWTTCSRPTTRRRSWTRSWRTRSWRTRSWRTRIRWTTRRASPSSSLPRRTSCPGHRLRRARCCRSTRGGRRRGARAPRRGGCSGARLDRRPDAREGNDKNDAAAIEGVGEPLSLPRRPAAPAVACAARSAASR
jgi:hypothetical protein